MTFFFQPFRIAERLAYGYDDETGGVEGTMGGESSLGSPYSGDAPADSSEGAGGDDDYTSRPRYDKNEYDAWKTSTNTDEAAYAALGDAGKRAQYLDWRYEEWNAGAHEVVFSDYEVAEFNRRDYGGSGPSDERKQNNAEYAAQEAVTTKYYHSDPNGDPDTYTDDPFLVGKPKGAYKKEMQRDGTWKEVLVKDYSGIIEQLRRIQEFEFDSFDDWQAKGEGREMNDIGESYQFKQIGSLADKLSAGSFDEGAINDALAYAAKGLGFDSAEEHQAYLESIRGTNPNDMEGMGAEEMATRQGLNRETFRQQELVATRALENIRASGKSTAQYLMRADEYISKLTSQKLQADMMLAQENYQRQDAQLQAQMRQYEFMVQTGNMSRTEYLQMYQENRAMGIQAYAMQINAMFQENQEVFQEYQTDMQAMAANLQNMYAAMNAEMGFEQWAIDTATQIYNNDLMPILTELQLINQDLANEMQEDYIQMMQQGNMMNFVGQIIGGIGKIFNPFG